MSLIINANTFNCKNISIVKCSKNVKYVMIEIQLKNPKKYQNLCG